MEVPSGLNRPAWKDIATGHPHDEIVLDGVHYGFSLHYHGPPIPTEGLVDNHRSATAFSKQVKEYISTELNEGAKSSDIQVPRRIIVDLPV